MAVIEMIRRLGRIGAMASVLCFAPVPAAAQASAGGVDLRALADTIVRPTIAGAGDPRTIVAISYHGRRTYLGYGGRGQAPLAADTVVEIGSITKVFTGVLLAEAFDRGAIDPNASIQAYLPGTKLGPCTARITPVELADFSSGLPRLPDDVPADLQARGIDRYTPRDMLQWLERTAPRTGCDLPAPYLYSNASVGLLGPILADATGRPWQALVAEHITGPLGMVDTAVAPPRLQAQGFTAQGGPAPRWPVFAWYAAGALRSTATDMLGFGEAALGHDRIGGRPVPAWLSQAFRRSMQPIYTRPNGGGVALSWETRANGSGGAMIYKDGGTAGFTSFVIVDPSKDCAVFLASDRAGVRLQQLGIQLLQAIPQ